MQFANLFALMSIRARQVFPGDFPRVIVLSLAGCLGAWGGTAVRAETPSFQATDYRTGMEQARQLNVPLLLHFHIELCAPCQRMEQTVFSSPRLSEALRGKLVLVKVDGQQAPELARMYQVHNYPADVFLDPQGRVLGTSVGQVPLQEYIQMAARVESRYRQSQPLLRSREESGQSPASFVEPEYYLGQPAPFPEWMYRSNEPDSSSARGESSLLAADEQEKVPQARVVFLALDGFCPVRLKTKREWVQGDSQWTYEHQQQQYRFASEQERQRFQEAPEDYAPRLLGCDPVIMWEADRAIPGTTEYAAYFNEELYLFTSEQNRELFRIDPERYINIRHVLKPSHVEATLIR